MSEKYSPKQGDRVRVVLEGEARPTDDSAFWVDDVNHIIPAHEHVISIEKLAPLEPKWVHGAVVKVKNQHLPFVHLDGVWHVAGGDMDFGHIIHYAWRDGRLTILWNGDTNV